MFVGTAVTLNAIVKLADAFLYVLAPDVGQRVFVTAIAGVTAVIVASMASGAGNVMVAIERKVLVVVKACWSPLLLRVTLKAIAVDFLVQGVLWLLVARLALVTRLFRQQTMVEAALQVVALHASVIAVAGHAVLTDQLLVKRRCRARLDNGQASRRQAANISHLVTGHAPGRAGTSQGRMTGKAIRLQQPVSSNQLARAHHQGMPTVTLPRHATLERCRMNSHAGAWELGVSWEDIFCVLPKLSLAGLSCLSG